MSEALLRVAFLSLLISTALLRVAILSLLMSVVLLHVAFLLLLMSEASFTCYRIFYKLLILNEKVGKKTFTTMEYDKTSCLKELFEWCEVSKAEFL
ncbi:MAG: hypothetical protein ABIT08_02585 [Bacteroidia bacterium]